MGQASPAPTRTPFSIDPGEKWLLLPKEQERRWFTHVVTFFKRLGYAITHRGKWVNTAKLANQLYEAGRNKEHWSVTETTELNQSFIRLQQTGVRGAAMTKLGKLVGKAAGTRVEAARGKASEGDVERLLRMLNVVADAVDRLKMDPAVYERISTTLKRLLQGPGTEGGERWIQQVRISVGKEWGQLDTSSKEVFLAGLKQAGLTFETHKALTGVEEVHPLDLLSLPPTDVREVIPNLRLLAALYPENKNIETVLADAEKDPRSLVEVEDLLDGIVATPLGQALLALVRWAEQVRENLPQMQVVQRHDAAQIETKLSAFLETMTSDPQDALNAFQKLDGLGQILEHSLSPEGCALLGVGDRTGVTTKFFRDHYSLFRHSQLTEAIASAEEKLKKVSEGEERTTIEKALREAKDLLSDQLDDTASFADVRAFLNNAFLAIFNLRTAMGEDAEQVIAENRQMMAPFEERPIAFYDVSPLVQQRARNLNEAVNLRELVDSLVSRAEEEPSERLRTLRDRITMFIERYPLTDNIAVAAELRVELTCLEEKLLATVGPEAQEPVKAAFDRRKTVKPPSLEVIKDAVERFFAEIGSVDKWDPLVLDSLTRDQKRLWHDLHLYHDYPSQKNPLKRLYVYFTKEQGDLSEIDALAELVSKCIIEVPSKWKKDLDARVDAFFQTIGGIRKWDPFARNALSWKQRELWDALHDYHARPTDPNELKELYLHFKRGKGVLSKIETLAELVKKSAVEVPPDWKRDLDDHVKAFKETKGIDQRDPIVTEALSRKQGRLWDALHDYYKKPTDPSNLKQLYFHFRKGEGDLSEIETLADVVKESAAEVPRKWKRELDSHVRAFFKKTKGISPEDPEEDPIVGSHLDKHEKELWQALYSYQNYYATDHFRKRLYLHFNKGTGNLSEIDDLATKVSEIPPWE